MFDTHGREVGYATGRPAQRVRRNWSRGCARIRIACTSGASASPASAREDVTDIEQTAGSLDRRAHQPFPREGRAVRCGHDVPSGPRCCCGDGDRPWDPIAIAIDFPYGSTATSPPPTGNRPIGIARSRTSGLIAPRTRCRSLLGARHAGRRERRVAAGAHRFEVNGADHLNCDVEFSAEADHQ